MSTRMPTRIAVIDPNRERALLIVDGLREAGDYDIHLIGDAFSAAKALKDIDPDIVLVDLQSPTRDSLESVTRASGPLERPVAMFVDRSDEAMLRDAIDAGVSAYVVDGFAKERIKPVLEAAIARFHAFDRLRAELEATKQALAERKLLDRAKGVIMQAKSVSEEEAYAILRKAAMDQNRKIVEIARSVVTAAELLR